MKNQIWQTIKRPLTDFGKGLVVGEGANLLTKSLNKDGEGLSPTARVALPFLYQAASGNRRLSPILRRSDLVGKSLWGLGAHHAFSAAHGYSPFIPVEQQRAFSEKFRGEAGNLIKAERDKLLAGVKGFGKNTLGVLAGVGPAMRNVSTRPLTPAETLGRQVGI